MIGPNSRNQRRILAATFLFIFAIAAPSLLVLASGWRWSNSPESNRSWLPTDQVAAINLKANPRSTRFNLIDAQGKIVISQTTPWISLNLQPGYYQVQFYADNYLPYTLDTVLRPGQGWQPTNIQLWPVMNWKIRSELPIDMASENSWWQFNATKNCFNWWPNNQAQMYCHPEIIKHSGAVNERLNWLSSQNWLGTLDRDGNQVKLQFFADNVVFSAFNQEFQSIITVSESSDQTIIRAWKVLPDGRFDSGQILLAESKNPKVKYVYGWDAEKQVLIRQTQTNNQNANQTLNQNLIEELNV